MSEAGQVLKEATKKAGEVLKTFTRVFLGNCGSCILDDIREEIREQNGEGPQKIPRRLTLREKSKHDRKEDKYRGSLWMKVGGGAGDFSKWKEVFVVEEDSCDITIYEDEKSANESKKPITVISPCGYQLVTDTRQYYKDDIETIMPGIREVDADFITMDLEAYTWALAHPIRPNYVFLARPSTVKLPSKLEMLCICKRYKAVEPENEAPEETEEEKERREIATEFMRTCVQCAEPRDTSEIEGRAFEMTARELPGELDNLRDDWTDDGTESEILVDILMEVCMEDRKNTILNERKGPPLVRIKLWNRIRKLVHTALSKLVDKAWTAARKLLAALREEIEPAIKTALTPIVKLRMTIESKINEMVLEKMGKLLGEFVNPFIKPLLALYESSLKGCFEEGRKFLEEKLNPSSLPDGTKERSDYLQQLMDDRKIRVELYKSLDKIEDHLQNVRSIGDAGVKVMHGARLVKIRFQIQRAVNEILDAAIYSYKMRLDPSGEASEDGTKGVTNKALESDLNENKKPDMEVVSIADPAEVLRQLLEDFDHDVQIMRSEFVKAAVHSMLLEAFHRIADPLLQPVIQQVNEAIPDRFEKFLRLPAILDRIIDRVVWLPVEQAVEVMYPLPVRSDNTTV